MACAIAKQLLNWCADYCAFFDLANGPKVTSGQGKAAFRQES